MNRAGLRIWNGKQSRVVKYGYGPNRHIVRALCAA